MNFLYIDCIIKEQKREIEEECERRLLLNWNRKMNTRFKSEGNKPISNAELQSRILEIASRFFQAKGFENTKVSDVCRGLGINRLQFYRHFHSLDEVLEIIWAR